MELVETQKEVIALQKQKLSDKQTELDHVHSIRVKESQVHRERMEELSQNENVIKNLDKHIKNAQSDHAIMEVQLLQFEKDKQQLETENAQLKKLVDELDQSKIEAEMKELKANNRELKDTIDGLEAELGDLMEDKNKIESSML